MAVKRAFDDSRIPCYRRPAPPSMQDPPLRPNAVADWSVATRGLRCTAISCKINA